MSVEAEAAAPDQAGQFIFFFDPGTFRTEDRIPIATGTTQEEAMRRGIPRLLMVAAEGGFWGLMQSQGLAIEQPGLSSAEFAQVTDTIERFFAEKAAA